MRVNSVDEALELVESYREEITAKQTSQKTTASAQAASSAAAAAEEETAE